MFKGTCGGCGKTWQVPKEDTDYRCRACGASVRAPSEGPTEDAATAVTVPPDEGTDARAEVDIQPSENAETANPPEVGTNVADAAPRAKPAPRSPRQMARNIERRREVADRKENVQKAGNWILAISLLFLGWGTIFGFVAKSQADDAKITLSRLGPDVLLTHPLKHNPVTVDELREEIDADVRLTFAVNYALAAIMFGLYFWGKKSPLPAMITAISVYAAVIVINAIVEPATIVQGLILKFVFFGAMIGGIKSCLAHQAEERLAMRRGASA